MRILLTSDNHLGYKETDNILGNDSFNTFEEILQIANTLEVDLMLQGGDLFHCNNPSKNTLIKTINLLKNYCLGNKSINNTSNNLNINDANLNIALPVVAIHGNHDDPSGVFIQSAYDILQSTGYINYIGKTSTIEYLNVTPTIIEGDKKVAIFGIGNIKDRALYKLFEQNKVNFNRPENYKDYVNILVVHQNRVQRSCKDYLPIEFVDDWFDLVIYGHEHDSMIFPVESKGFTVIQSGSTVRTSLCDAEVGEKYCYLLEIQDTVKINRIKLNTVRNFIMKTIKVEENLESTLKYEIDKMIENETCPLIRLRIDFDGEKINKRKFGLPYKDRVANYADMISFINKKKLVVGEKIEKKEMKDVLNMFMEKIDLKAIPESLFIDGVRKFAENGDKEIFSTIVNSTVLNSVKHLKNDILDRDTIERKITFLKDEVNKENNYVKKKDEPHQFDLNKNLSKCDYN